VLVQKGIALNLGKHPSGDILGSHRLRFLHFWINLLD
jgi:hypothetical protein